jgi:hypothetical protein
LSRFDISFVNVSPSACRRFCTSGIGVHTNLWIVVNHAFRLVFGGAPRLWPSLMVTGLFETYIFPTPSYTFVSEGRDETSEDVNCSMRPSLVRAAFCCRTMTSCCSAKAFFWPISCRTCTCQFRVHKNIEGYYIPSARPHLASTS